MATTDTVSRAAAPNGREGRALQKGQQTKATIVDAALALAAQIGLEPTISRWIPSLVSR